MNYIITYRNTNNGGDIIRIERKDKYASIIEDDERRYTPKQIVINGKNNAHDFIYNLKLSISMIDAKEIFDATYWN